MHQCTGQFQLQSAGFHLDPEGATGAMVVLAPPLWGREAVEAGVSELGWSLEKFVGYV